jgi:hypothetical protein
MTHIVIAIILAYLLSLAIYVGVPIGIAWLINTLAGTNISYVLAGGIGFGLWLLIIVIKALALYGVYKEGGR